MSFASFGFLLVFLPVALGGFALVSRLGPAAAMAWLILCSLAFYPLAHVPLLLASITGTALLGRWVRATEAAPRTQTAVLTFGIAANLAAMGLSREMADGPPGISFIVFTQIGFLLDQRGARRSDLLATTLLVVFFPHLIAGPILRERDVAGQFADPATWRPRGGDLAAGGFLLLLGLLKKTLLADPLGAIVTPGFAAPGALGCFAAWAVAIGWSFQLYFDFSGYSDMAIGLARMFGVRLPGNFASPYKAQSVIDYWQRWHMTLTRFLMSTVYNPLALGILRWRRGKGWATDRAAQRTAAGFGAMLLAPLVATMVLAGLWHGVTLPYLVFGLLHAGFLAVNHAWRLWVPAARSRSRAAVAGRVALTYGCVLIGAVVFRAPSLDAAGSVFAGMLGLRPDQPDAHRLVHALWLVALGVIVWGMPNTREIMEGGSAWPSWRPTAPWAVAAGCAATLGLLSLGGTRGFVYFQF